MIRRDATETNQQRRSPSSKIAMLVIVVVTLVLAVFCSSAQNQRPSPVGSDLSRANLNRVAASAAQIKGVLVQDAGLMIELKRWVAKDAADHGQIVGDSDLSDDAIFDRLETDGAFRAVATQLLQRYG